MKSKINNKKGILVIALAAGLCFVLILFASLSERIRNEAAVTNRVSVTERLDQISCAVGRIAIRKLQTDIDIRDDYGQEIIDKIINEHKTKTVQFTDKEEAFTRTINNMAIINDFKKEYNKKHGDKIQDFKVSYSLYLGSDEAFGEPIPGVMPNKNERKGHIDMAVTTVLKSGIKRKYTIRKDFIFAFLLAPPFHRFTLFSHKGADLKDDEANSLQYEYNGELQSDSKHKKPLVCVNSLHSKDYNFDFKSKLEGNDDAFSIFRDNFYKNGWIYLGGNGNSTDINSDSNNLILNVVPGSGDDNYESKFGEFFHFYYDKSSQGWLVLNDWSDWLKSNIDGNGSGICKMVFVEYGLYNGLLNIAPYKSTSYDEYVLFDSVEDQYKNSFNPGVRFNPKKGSSIHLFGTPSHCTPTMIFGKVKSRYLRCLGLYFTNIGRVFPFRSVPHGGYLGSVLNCLSGLYLEASAGQNVTPTSESVLNGLKKFLPVPSEGDSSEALLNELYLKYYNKDGTKVCLGPKIIDCQPYITSLKNILYPKEPSKNWDKTDELRKVIKKPEDVCDSSFNFQNSKPLEEEIDYNGNIEDIKIDYKTYLKNKTTYTFGDENNEEGKRQTFNIDDDFFKKHFFVKSETSTNWFLKLFSKNKEKECFYLDQVIRINGSLNINKQLNVTKGGVIVCTGQITISEPIYNEYLERVSKNVYHFKPDENNPDSFGYLTLVAQEGIVIKVSKKNEDDTMPTLHSFLIAGCGDGSGETAVYTEQPVHIIGGVATDNIKRLVETGSIIEWGFTPNEVTNIDNKDFYGLTLGPRDIEIYSDAE